MSIIALCGFQGSGKDTFANILIEKFGYTKLSFAGIVKDIVAIMFDWDRNMLEGVTTESRLWREEIDIWWSNRLNIKNLTPRWILQHIATDVFRDHFHKDIWIACIEKKLSKLNKVVITDARFDNEFNTIKKLGGSIIHIKNDKIAPYWYNNKFDIPNDIHPSEYRWIYNKFDIPNDIHPSEYSWIYNKPDYIIENNGTIKDLEINISSFLNKKII